MSAKHTPGPWYWHTDHAGNVSIRTPDRGNLIVMDCVRKGMNGATVRLAYWQGLPGGLPRERKGGVLDSFNFEHPDARLIAAAPELLEALQRTAKHLQFLADNIIDDETAAHAACNEVCRQARAAIAKAEGRQ